ncbi:MAG: transketolase family protein [Bacilli bacterium]
MKRATRESYAEALKQLGEMDDSIVVLDADLSKATKTSEFQKAFPERFINVGIQEQNLMGVAAGLAQTGHIPFASSFAVFAAGRAFEIIRNSICYPKANVKIGATHGGITVGPDGGSHQAIEDLALMNSLPNMVVLNPADDRETQQAIIAAAKHEGPVYIRLGRIAVEDLYDDTYSFEIGKGSVLQTGTDVTIIATGLMVHTAKEAVKELQERGIACRLVNMASVKPIDHNLIIEAAKETKGIVTVEEHSIYGGLGSIVSSIVSEETGGIVRKVGVNDTFGESGNPTELMEKYGLTKERIIEEVEHILHRNL